MRGGGARLCLCGDVMLGRGIDQILAYPADPRLFEPFVGMATEYVALAEGVSGPIPRQVDERYVWGDALAAWQQAGPDARIINLETSITRSLSPLPKGINYKMAPANAGVLKAAGIDCCVLANNHVLDWGEVGLLETLATLDDLGIAHAGAGRDLTEAWSPAVIEPATGQRVLVFACGSGSSGIPPEWGAAAGRPGVSRLGDLSPASVEDLAARIKAVRREGDLVVVSIHWGGNWGYRVPEEQRRFAHALIDRAGVNVVHGHSSHHAKAIEMHEDRLVLYGCGDFLNDYEGIAGYEEYRGDLAVSYLPCFAADGALSDVTLLPFRIRKLRLQRPEPADVDWLQRTLDRESGAIGTHFAAVDGARLMARW